MGRPDEHDPPGGRRKGATLNLLVRCWYEPSQHGTSRLRGQLCRLSGTPIGAFDSEAALFRLLRQTLRDHAAPRPRDNTDEPR